MADPAHLEIAKKGAKAIARRRSGQFVRPMDLSAADLLGADLSAADLSGANLLMSDLTGANLAQANLALAKLIGANLTRADLTRADLSAANLSGANFSVADLSGANFSRAQCFATGFGDCDLSQCRGLETVAHVGPSSIGIDTLLRTARAGGGAFSAQVRVFLLGAGVPRELLDTVPQLVREIRYYSCFIAYGTPDKGIAERLYEDLKARGSCWLFDADAPPGGSVWGEIGKARREADKVIVTCSAASLVRDGLLKEIEETADEDPSKLVPISLDNTWRQRGFLVQRGDRDLKPPLGDRIYADFEGWEKDEKIYAKGLERLLRGLQREKAAKGG